MSITQETANASVRVQAIIFREYKSICTSEHFEVCYYAKRHGVDIDSHLVLNETVEIVNNA
ncbi:hypothetical protein [Clostridium sp. BJN0013]|uniref:hypothetical protein n=1 Tax=Clostridium sp. BJN0013 TaxID=3236840 RepID=UPI0034C66444